MKSLKRETKPRSVSATITRSRSENSRASPRAWEPNTMARTAADSSKAGVKTSRMSSKVGILDLVRASTPAPRRSGRRPQYYTAPVGGNNAPPRSGGWRLLRYGGDVLPSDGEYPLRRLERGGRLRLVVFLEGRAIGE